MFNQHGRNRVIWRLIILTLIGLLLAAGVGSLFSSVAVKWLLILAPFVVGFLAAAGLVWMSDRRWPKADAWPRRLIVNGSEFLPHSSWGLSSPSGWLCSSAPKTARVDRFWEALIPQANTTPRLPGCLRSPS
jgi:hypothetical protein